MSNTLSKIPKTQKETKYLYLDSHSTTVGLSTITKTITTHGITNSGRSRLNYLLRKPKITKILVDNGDRYLKGVTDLIPTWKR